MAQIILDSNNNLIQGDFDNATLNNRTKLQTTTTNATTNVYVVPNGSSTSAGVSVANNSSLTNASKIVMATNGTTDTQIISGVNGSGSYLPLSFYTNNALAMQITTAGNILVAATAAPAFSAYVNIAQTITTNVFTKIQFNTEEFDTNSNYDNVTNYRFTPTVAGYYQVQVSLFPGTITSQSAIAIYKNGANFKAANIAAATVSVVATALIYMNGTTDYLEGFAYLVGTTPSVAANQSYSYFQASMARSA
jgi:hypothetical protein